MNAFVAYFFFLFIYDNDAGLSPNSIKAKRGNVSYGKLYKFFYDNICYPKFLANYLAYRKPFIFLPAIIIYIYK
jgi:hypothetical protein